MSLTVAKLAGGAVTVSDICDRSDPHDEVEDATAHAPPSAAQAAEMAEPTAASYKAFSDASDRNVQ